MTNYFPKLELMSGPTSVYFGVVHCSDTTLSLVCALQVLGDEELGTPLPQPADGV